MKKISVVIAGRHTSSISLEEEFWQELKIIADLNGQSINQLVTQIDAQKDVANLSSAIRVYVLKQLKKKATEK